MIYQIASQWRMILSALILIALAAFALVKGVSVLAEDTGSGGGQPRQTVQAPATGAGERAVVAGTPVEAAAAEAQQATPRPPSGTTYHTVKTGETLGKIALQYGVTAAALASANGITNPDVIRVGQKLTVPAR